MGVKFSNNGHSTLASSITSSDTSITVASGHGARFPSLGAGDYFYATLIDASNNLEIVKCTARSSDVLTVTRGQESTTARAYAIGDRIELRVTAAGLEAVYSEAVADATPGADTIVNSMIATGAVNADSIAADAVGSSEIAANAVGASELNVSGNGTAGQALLSDGDGTMSWGAAGALTKVASGDVSAVSSVTEDGVFNTSSEIYIVRFTMQMNSNAQVRFNLRGGGSNITSNYYSVSDHAYGNTGNNNIHILSNGGYIQFGTNNQTAGERHSGFIEIYNPNAAKKTFFNFMTHGYESSGQHDNHQGGGYHNSNTAYNGFRLYASSGNFTGQYIVYECKV